MKIFENKYVETTIVILLLLIIIALRINNLEADPPDDLSISTDVYTDPAQYTLFAKQYVSTGELNPFNDNRFLFFIKSSVTALAILIFNLFGVSIFSSNLTGLIYSFGSLFLFYLIIRKSANKTAAILFLLLISVNYNQIFYGRLPFLEHAMAFYAFLSIVILIYFQINKGYLLGGISLAIAIFFGKIIGIVFLIPISIYFYHLYLTREKEFDPRKLWYYLGGLAGIALIWFFVFYLPLQEQVTSYVEEQAFSLYGFPMAFRSFDNFVWKFVSFGDDSKLFSRMAIPSILGVYFIGSIFIKSSKSISSKRTDSRQILIISIIIAFYLFLMIWNYRPLRYQLVLIYPIYGLAAIVLSNFLDDSGIQINGRIKLWKVILIFPLVYPVIYQLFDSYIIFSRGEFFYTEYRWTVIFISLVISAVVFAISNLVNAGYISTSSVYKKILAFSLIVIMLIPSAESYNDWTKRVSYNIRDNSIDLSTVISDNAVVSGPYAPALTQVNDKATIIHMFGVSKTDSAFFDNRPITHLLLDYSNEKRAEADYPILMNSSKYLLDYYIGLKKVKLYRIAGLTNNGSANEYQLSEFESIVELYTNDTSNIDTSLIYRFLEQNQDNISGYLLIAKLAERKNNLVITEKMYKKAVEFSPTNYNLNARLGEFYKERFDLTGIDWYKQEGLKYYNNAVRLAPSVYKYQKALRELDRTEIDRDTN